MKPLILTLFFFAMVYVASTVDKNSACYVRSQVGQGKQKSITIKYQSIFMERVLLASMRSGKENSTNG
jgi:hypothetical protein